MASPKKRARSKPLAQKSQDLESYRDIADDVIESDFVPYACMFDQNTIATKDGELVHTIKITGHGLDTRGLTQLRQAIRQAIRQTIPDTSYALWLHTLRRKQPLDHSTHYPDAFSGKLDEAWRSQWPTATSFVNELYITIVKASADSRLRDPNVLLQSLWPKRDADIRSAQMETAMRELTETSARFVNALKAYGARLLSMVERDGVFYSEQLEFLEKLINLEARPMPMPTQDLSLVLTSGEITFGYNAMEVRTADNHRRFAAILTLKEYKESTLAGIDRFLEIPCEVIITQSFDFVDGDEAREAYEKQAHYLAVSGDRELAKWIEIDRLIDGQADRNPRNFGKQQTTLFLIATSISQLESNVRLVQKSLTRLGMIVIREDLRFEDCYWAQLPGNFTFIARNQPVDTEHLAGFANLQTSPMGNAKGSPWGAPVSIFSTVQDAPYFFNFHQGASAHSIILGKPGSGRTTFTHFLLAQVRKLPVAIWYLDGNGRGSPFIEAMGGRAQRPGMAQCRLNPLQLPDNPTNREFLSVWLSTLIDPQASQLNRSMLDFFKHLVTQLYTLPATTRTLSNLLPMIREADALLATHFQQFCLGGVYGDLFDMPQDDFSPTTLSLWDISAWMKDPATRVSLASYLLHRMTLALTGEPTLIVLSDGFEQLDTPLFGARSPAWLDYLTSRNAAVLMTAGSVEASASYNFTPMLASKSASIFAMPDAQPDAGYAMGFGFTPQDMGSLAYISPAAHQVFQKRGEEAVVLKMDLGALGPATLAVLGGRAAPLPIRTAADQLADLMGYGKLAV